MKVSSLRSSSLQPGGSNFKHSCSASRALSNLALTEEESETGEYSEWWGGVLVEYWILTQGQYWRRVSTFRAYVKFKVTLQFSFNWSRHWHLNVHSVCSTSGSHPAARWWPCRRHSCSEASVETCPCGRSVCSRFCTAAASIGPGHSLRDQAPHWRHLVRTTSNDKPQND